MKAANAASDADESSAADFAFRQAADKAMNSAQAREIGDAASNVDLSTAADYAYRKAGSLPPAPRHQVTHQVLFFKWTSTEDQVW